MDIFITISIVVAIILSIIFLPFKIYDLVNIILDRIGYEKTGEIGGLKWWLGLCYLLFIILFFVIMWWVLNDGVIKHLYPWVQHQLTKIK